MQNKDTTRTVTRSAGAYFSGTLLSRISGLGRDVAMAYFLGSSAALATFFVAYRFANLFRRLIGESFSALFIPHFETLRQRCPKEGAFFFRDLLATLTLFLIVLLAVSEGLLSLLPKGETLFLTQLMLPSLLFISLYGVCSALLQCEKKYFLPSFAPFFFNFTWIATVISITHLPSREGIITLSIGVVCAFFFQYLCVSVPSLRILKKELSFKQLLTPRIFPKTIRSLFRPVSLGLIGIGATQVNTALDALFAKFASPEGPAILWYAIRIEQIPIALIAVAVSNALLPPLSRAEGENFNHLLTHALRKIFTLIIPCTCALLALAHPLIQVLFERGLFTEGATLSTTLSLQAYTLGLLPHALVLTLVPAYYARKDYRTPTRIFLLTVMLNIALNALFVFVFHFKETSVALATSISAFANLFFLIRPFKLPPYGKILFVSVLAGVITYCGYLVLPHPSSFFLQLGSIIFLSIIFLLMFVLAAKLFRLKDLFKIK